MKKFHCHFKMVSEEDAVVTISAKDEDAAWKQMEKLPPKVYKTLDIINSTPLSFFEYEMHEIKDENA